MRIIKQPTIEPITLAEVKAQLGMKATDTNLDAVIARRISEARIWAEDYMQRVMAPRTLEKRLNDFPHLLGELENRIQLSFPDLISVVSIKYIDLDGVEQTVSASDYIVDSFDYVGGVQPAYGKSWPYPREQKDAVRIQYTCGYSTSALADAKTITGATKATPGVFTSAGHGFADGDLIKMTATGMTEVDGNLYLVYGKQTDTFQLANLRNTAGISTANYGTFTAGTAQRVELLMPELLKEALILLMGHWMNYQPQSENGISLARVPYAVRDLFDKFSRIEYA